MAEEDCYSLLETCLEHPNLEIIQLAEKNYKAEDLAKEEKDKSKGKAHRKDS